MVAYLLRPAAVKAAPPTAIPSTTCPVHKYHACRMSPIQSYERPSVIRRFVNESEMMSPTYGASPSALQGRNKRYELVIIAQIPIPVKRYSLKSSIECGYSDVVATKDWEMVRVIVMITIMILLHQLKSYAMEKMITATAA